MVDLPLLLKRVSGLLLVLRWSCVSGPAADMNQMDHGPFATWTIAGDTTTHKGIVIKVESDLPAVMCFDTDLLRMSAGWTNGFLRWYPERDGLEKNPTPRGAALFSNDVGPGWSSSGSFKDPRPLPYGPLPRDWARYRGLYLNGNRVVLSYSVGECQILESPGFRRMNDGAVFSRTFNLSETKQTLALRVCRVALAAGKLETKAIAAGKSLLVAANSNSIRFVGANGLPTAARWEIQDGHLILGLPRLEKPLRFTLLISSEQNGERAGRESRFADVLSQESLLPDLGQYCQAGPARWGAPLITQGVMGSEDGPLAVDTLTVPEKNPWNSWIRCTGLDFLPDGRAVVASVSGDIWLVAGIEERLGELTWKRFATGLYQPLGVKVVAGQIYVTCRDQVHRLHDLNGDGEADFYENFNNDCMVAENFHEYTMNLETDSKGDFYYTKGAPWPPDVKHPHAGVLFRLSKDGQRLETYATGLRGPNGLAIGPNDEITFSDNEGHWVPTCSLQWVKKDGFFGMKPTAHRDRIPDEFEKPICWIPHNIDNSPGGQIWVPKDAWGPLAGHLLLTSYGKSTLSLVLTENVGGQMQGGLVRLPLKFESGLIRGRFHKEDGHLYLCGLRVWQSTGLRYGALHRLRYTGKPFHMPVELHAKHNGLELSFSCELDPKASADPQDYSVHQWNYRWIERYGSPHFSVKDPDQVGHDPVEVASVRLSQDRKTIFLEIPGIQPVMQMRIAYNIRAADGTELNQEIYSTINRLP